MKKLIKKAVNLRMVKLISYKIDWLVWNLQGKPIPTPHIVKQKLIRLYAEKFSADNFVETGTYLGEMIDAQKNFFKKIFSVELDDKLFNEASEKFKNLDNIKIVHGDSSKALVDIVGNLKGDTIFWLDGHYSAGVTAKGDLNTPILKELEAIFKNRKQSNQRILLIDDARCFIGKDDYPTLEELKKEILKYNKNYKIEIIDDVICAIPN